MKKLFIALTILGIITSCGKDKDNTTLTPKNKFMSKWSWTYGANGVNNAEESFTLNNDNKLISSIYHNSELSSQPVTYSYTRNDEGRITKQQWNQSYRTYEYNSVGQLLKSSLYNTSGSLISYYIFNYSTDGYERVSYSSSGVSGSKLVCTYTTDKKNIAKEVWYSSSGNVAQETQYTYYTTKSATSIYPYSEVIILDKGFVSENAINIATTIIGSTSYTIKHTYSYNSDGLPIFDNEVNSNGEPPSIVIYEYIER